MSEEVSQSEDIYTESSSEAEEDEECLDDVPLFLTSNNSEQQRPPSAQVSGLQLPSYSASASQGNGSLTARSALSTHSMLLRCHPLVPEHIACYSIKVFVVQMSPKRGHGLVL